MRELLGAAALALLSQSIVAQPIIIQEPVSRAAAEGRRVTFSVEAQGDGPLQYQWKFNGVDIPRASGRTIRFTATLSRAGNYTVVVRDSAGGSRAATAELAVQKRPIILAHPRNQIVGEHQTAFFQVAVNASGPYSYVNWWHHSTAEPTHPIPLGAARGVNTFRLEIPDATDNGTFNGLYWIRITNQVGGAMSRRASLTVVGPPRLISEPQDKVAARGRAASFSISIAPDVGGRKTIQWYHNGRLIPGAAGRILRLRNVQPDHAGYYHARVTGIGGFTDSYGALLTVN